MSAETDDDPTEDYVPVRAAIDTAAWREKYERMKGRPSHRAELGGCVPMLLDEIDRLRAENDKLGRAVVEAEAYVSARIDLGDPEKATENRLWNVLRYAIGGTR